MRLLVLGGTKFLGRAVVERALERGDEVTLFNRGQTNPDLFPEVERLRGDRDGDLAALEGRSWDAVVDPSGYVPRVVRASAERLARNGVGYYVFVSSISAYADLSLPVDESSPLATLADPTSEDVAEHYGALKALCERVVGDVFPGRSASVRAGLIVGPHDPTGRFTYWPHRIARGGEVLVPGRPERRVQFIDVRDLASWMLSLAERRVDGVFNATGPVPAVTMRELVETCRAVSGSDATFTWVADEFLLERDVGEWMELPLWIAGPEYRHLLDVDVSRAVAAGLTFRPLEQTVAGTLADARLTGDAGLAPEREEQLLTEWHGG
jgi:2'-hydroxyisoflavone reductase